MKPLRIYVAGPYSSISEASKESNVRRAIDAGLALFKKGHYPYIPHLTHYVDGVARMSGIDMGYEDYMAWDFAFLDRCDALLFLEHSPGANRELRHAIRHEMEVYLTVDDVPEVH